MEIKKLLIGDIVLMVDVKKYDFFSQNRKDFYNKFSHESVLCQGRYWDQIPFVTILITTYKRPELLRRALTSALNQRGFDDYQIMIVDNEGRPVEEETPTSKVVKCYEDDRIIYYRHTQETPHIQDAAVRLSKSPWIVFLNDDDILAEDHLAIMTDIVKKNGEIKFLACKAKEFISEHDIEKEKDKNVDSNCHVIVRLLKDATCFGNWSGWLGALISRKHYIAIGGMPLVGCGDKVMVCIFHHYYGTYKLETGRPLYYYQIGEQQLSYTNREDWERIQINEFYFERYVIRKYHRFMHKLWERNLAYLILQKCEFYNHERYHAQIDIDHVIYECDMPIDIRKRNLRYYTTRSMFSLYRKGILHLAYFYMQRLKKSDIYVEL